MITFNKTLHWFKLKKGSLSLKKKCHPDAHFKNYIYIYMILSLFTDKCTWNECIVQYDI